jgi:hypothetical protein
VHFTIVGDFPSFMTPVIDIPLKKLEKVADKGILPL